MKILSVEHRYIRVVSLTSNDNPGLDYSGLDYKQIVSWVIPKIDIKTNTKYTQHCT